MKRALILFLVVTVLLSAGFIAAHAAVNSQKENVTWQEETLWGDKSAVDGLHVTAQNDFNHSLLWTTTGILGPTLAPETEFSFSNGNHTSPFPERYTGVNLSKIYSLHDIENFEWAEEKTKAGLTALNDYYQTCVAETPEGEERQYVVDLAQYLDYYLLDGTIDLPGQTIFNWMGDWTGNQVARVFNDYFRIPIVGAWRLDFTVDKNYDNVSSSSGMTADFSPEFHGVAGENTCYFTFNAYVKEGVSADCSMIPGGYGIYAIDYTMENGNAMLVFDSLRTVYPLDPAELYLDMTASADGKQLLLQTRDADNVYLTVIDIATMSKLQKLIIAPADEAYYDYRFLDNALVTFRYRGDTDLSQVIVCERLQNGTYRHAFTTDLNEMGVDIWSLICFRGTHACQLLYNGDILVIGFNGCTKEEYEEWYQVETCDFYIAAYNAAGMAYAGLYRVSLTDVNNSTIYFPCDNFGNYPLQISWE